MFTKSIFAILIVMLMTSFTMLSANSGDGDDEKLECEFYSYQDTHDFWYL